MQLRSNLFKLDKALEACAAKDSAHVTQGSKGAHVMKIQAAIIDLDKVTISPIEISAKLFGPSTASAVLAYKEKRKIINHGYQTKPDNIVGRMTIAKMDDELFGKQKTPVPLTLPSCYRR